MGIENEHQPEEVISVLGLWRIVGVVFAIGIPIVAWLFWFAPMFFLFGGFVPDDEELHDLVTEHRRALNEVRQVLLRQDLRDFSSRPNGVSHEKLGYVEYGDLEDPCRWSGPVPVDSGRERIRLTAKECLMIRNLIRDLDSIGLDSTGTAKSGGVSINFYRGLHAGPVASIVYTTDLREFMPATTNERESRPSSRAISDTLGEGWYFVWH